jgi:hypothetical protein
VGRIAEQYRQWVKPGFYRKVLVETARLDSCQVNDGPFHQSNMPDLLLQDISIVGMHIGPDFKSFGSPSGIAVKELADWHKVIDWWFEKYARYAVAVKSQAAYSRDLDYDEVKAEQAAPIFRRVLAKEPVSAEEKKRLEDHLFWYAVGKATEHDLPVKLHTGYYAGQNKMPLARVAKNPASVCEVVRRAGRGPGGCSTPSTARRPDHRRNVQEGGEAKGMRSADFGLRILEKLIKKFLTENMGAR